MKYKIIANISDGIIATSKNKIICVAENSICQNNQDMDLLKVNIGDIISDKNLVTADFYWTYTKKEWNDINKKAFKP